MYLYDGTLNQRIGEILRELPKSNKWESNSDAQEVETKASAIEDAGISRSQAYDLQKLAANPEVVQAVLDKAEAEGRIPRSLCKVHTKVQVFLVRSLTEPTFFPLFQIITCKYFSVVTPVPQWTRGHPRQGGIRWWLMRCDRGPIRFHRYTP